jgi:hypothetical protein
MTDSGDARDRGRLSWLRDVLSLRRLRPQSVRPSKDAVEAATLRVQIQILQDAFERAGDKVAVARRRDGGLAYLYHPTRALVHADDVAAVEGFFAERGDVYQDTGRPEVVIDDALVRYHFPARHDGEVALLKDLDELDREVGEGVATPDHVLYVTPRGSACPASEPVIPAGARPVPALNRNPGAGAGVRVSVVDTGWYSPAAKHPSTDWIASGVEGDEEQLKTNGTTTVIHEYAGHGTFVSGIVKCLAPATDIEVEGFLTKGGAIWESEIAEQLNEAMLDYEDDPATRELDPKAPDIISISAGTHTRKNLPLLGFQILGAIFKWDQDEVGPLVVAAAGNDSSKEEFWPAAFDWVLSVGSLDADGKRSDFSNFGDWVKVWALGRDLVNAFPSGEYTYVEPKSGKLLGTKQAFDGLAQWSGTSFATPVVTGAIAAYMTEHDCSAREARDALIGKPHVVQDPTLGGLTALGPPFVPQT